MSPTVRVAFDLISSHLSVRSPGFGRAGPFQKGLPHVSGCPRYPDDKHPTDRPRPVRLVHRWCWQACYRPSGIVRPSQASARASIASSDAAWVYEVCVAAGGDRRAAAAGGAVCAAGVGDPGADLREQVHAEHFFEWQRGA